MSKRRGWALFGLILLAIACWWLGRSPEPATAPASIVATPGGQPAATPLTPAAREKLLRDSPEAHLADALNQPGGTLQSDVAIVGSLIAAYRSFYPGRGNPVGDNREITATLLGRNPNGIILLQTGHPAINAQGELCDRWGTPFHFHAESGTKMEVRSAGPDRKLWTPDDVFLIP